MPLIAYLDEAGDHALAAPDRDFPVFALSLLVADTTAYATRIVPAVYALKLELWGHEGVILHSRDIRKAQGPFAFLTEPGRRPSFYAQLNAIVGLADVAAIAVAVRKDAHRALHKERARDPYDLALRFAFERLLLLLEDAGQREIRVIAEARGRREDDTLRRSVVRLLRRGTGTVAADRFQRVAFHLEFLPKAMNVVGTQLADLIAYPVARYALRPTRSNLAFEVLEPRLCRRGDERIGFAVYPPWPEESPEKRTAPVPHRGHAPAGNPQPPVELPAT